jgi:hypothetical protein
MKLKTPDFVVEGARERCMKFVYKESTQVHEVYRKLPQTLFMGYGLIQGVLKHSLYILLIYSVEHTYK